MTRGAFPILWLVLMLAFGCSSETLHPIEPGSPAADYVLELKRNGWLDGREGAEAPDGSARLVFESHQGVLIPGPTGRHTIWLEPRDAECRRLFSIWEADPGSGFSFWTRWSSDSRALLINGQGRLRDAPEHLEVVYLVEQDELWQLPVFEGPLEDAIQAATHSDPVVAFPALTALGLSTDPAATSILREQTTHPDSTWRRFAMETLLSHSRRLLPELAASAAATILFSEAPAQLRGRALPTWVRAKGREGLLTVAEWLPRERDPAFLKELRLYLAKKPWPEAREVEGELDKLGSPEVAAGPHSPADFS